MKLSPIRLEVPARLIRQFKRQAREAFPRETLAYLIGTDAGTAVEIEGLFVPEGIRVYVSTFAVAIQPHWSAEAHERAKEDGAEVIGTIHSHPYTKRELVDRVADRGLSEGDRENLGEYIITAVCTVTQSQSGKLRSSIRFWGPTVPVETWLTK